MHTSASSAVDWLAQKLWSRDGAVAVERAVIFGAEVCLGKGCKLYSARFEETAVIVRSDMESRRACGLDCVNVEFVLHNCR